MFGESPIPFYKTFLLTVVVILHSLPPSLPHFLPPFRYVALNTLLRTVHIDNKAVQRHRNTILDCLKENDISLQRRALELSFALVDSNNIRSMMKEILLFLEKADPVFKPYICTNILLVTDKCVINPKPTLTSTNLPAGTHPTTGGILILC